MGNSWKLIAIGAAALIALGGLSATYIGWKHHVQKEVRIESERKLHELKEKAHDAKTNALTAPDPRGELRKYARPE